MHYNSTRKEIEKSSKLLFNKILNGEIKESIYKIMKLENASDAHKLIQSRETTGSIILQP